MIIVTSKLRVTYPRAHSCSKTIKEQKEVISTYKMSQIVLMAVRTQLKLLVKRYYLLLFH